MARRRKGRSINGIVLLDKPLGGSSNQLLQKVRWLYKAQKAGHTGALDPLASGMLPLCLGEATKFSQFLLDAEKTYEVTAKLGVRTTTSDADGEVVEEKPVEVNEAQVNAACLAFLGKSKQIPSMFSARLPTRTATFSLVSRNAIRARRLKRYVASTINGTIEKVTSASRGSMRTIATTVPAMSMLSPTIVTSPSLKRLLMTETSFMTRETVTPVMCRSLYATESR